MALNSSDLQILVTGKGQECIQASSLFPDDIFYIDLEEEGSFFVHFQKKEQKFDVRSFCSAVSGGFI